MTYPNYGEPAHIIGIIDDLNLQCAEDAKGQIAKFCVRHNLFKLPTNQLMYILLGLIFLHDKTLSIESAVSQSAVSLIHFIYVKEKFTSEDLNLLAHFLIDLRLLSPEEFLDKHHQQFDSPAWSKIFLGYIDDFANPSKLLSYLNDDQVVSKEINKPRAYDSFPDYGFGYYEFQGDRHSQEDALVWSPLPESMLAVHSPQEIAKRLWTVYRGLNSSYNRYFNSAGTTASTTICTRDALITATLGDTTAYAVIYTENSEFEVYRLNSQIRHPYDLDELSRINAASGFVRNGRVSGRLSLSRAIGDKTYRGVCADADVDIFDLREYQNALKVQLITACDGFLEPLIYEAKLSDTKPNCEAYLQGVLHGIQLKLDRNIFDLDEMDIANELVQSAYDGGSKDNISVSVQTIRKCAFNFVGMLGVYDGHGGCVASHFVADNIVAAVKRQLKLSVAEYARQQNSASRNHTTYARDNYSILEDESPSISMVNGGYQL